MVFLQKSAKKWEHCKTYRPFILHKETAYLCLLSLNILLLFLLGGKLAKGFVGKCAKHIHCKKSLPIFPSPARMSLIKLSLGWNNDVTYKLFPPRESLVSDIPAGDGNIEKLFLRCEKKKPRRFLFPYYIPLLPPLPLQQLSPPSLPSPRFHRLSPLSLPSLHFHRLPPLCHSLLLLVGSCSSFS
jgi:hypothetical protein